MRFNTFAAGVLELGAAAAGGKVLATPRTAAKPPPDTGAVIQPRQLIRDPNSEFASCVSTSMKFPGWQLWGAGYNYVKSSDGTHGVFGVGVSDNIDYAGVGANDNSEYQNNFNCYGNDIDLYPAAGEGWHDCEAPEAQFRFAAGDPPTLTIRRNWTCAEAPELQFSGEGTTIMVLPGGCLDDGLPDEEGNAIMTCIMVDSQMFPTLSEPLNLEQSHPLYPWLVFLFPEDCVTRASTPLFTVEDFLYVHHGPESQTLSFKIINFSNGAEMECTVSLNETDIRASEHMQSWVDCDAALVDSDVSSGGNIFNTQVIYNKDYGVLSIKQNYECASQTLSTGRVVAQQNLTSLAINYQAPECTEDIVYWGGRAGDEAAYTCRHAAFNISGYAEQDMPTYMPHTDYLHSCTSNSVVARYMMLTAFDAKPDGSVLVRIQNPSPEDNYGFVLDEVEKDGEWHECTSSSGLPWQLESCAYRYPPGGEEVGFKLEWLCDDADPLHSILFTATIEGNLPSGQQPSNITVTDLSWKTRDGPMTRGPSLPWI